MSQFHKFNRLKILLEFFGINTEWLGKLYNSKQYSLIRQFDRWRRRTIKHVYRSHIDVYLFNRKEKRWRKLIKISDYAKKNGIQLWRMENASLVETPEPKFLSACNRYFLRSPHKHYIFPDIFVAKINKGIINGESNLIIAGNEVICHDLYDFERDYTNEEYRWRTLINPKLGVIRLLTHDLQPERIPVAASFVDACSSNYAHWLTEVLSRIAIFCSDERFKRVPIIVNDRLHKNIMESLLRVVGYDRKIITLQGNKSLFVEELYITSPAGYVPYERRNNGLTGHSHGVFSPKALELICSYINAEKNMPDHGWPEKIYVRRNSGIRNIVNNEEVEKLLTEHGVVIVEPEKLSFFDQSRLFANAKLIIAPTGAALANIIFCQRDSKIFILISELPDVSYWYWQNIACASGKSVSYIFGKVVNTNNNIIHSDYSIDIANLRLALDGIL